MKEVLISINCLDLYHVLHQEDIKAHNVMKLGIEELEDIGVESEKASRFLQEVQIKTKEQEGKDALKYYLTAMKSIKHYDVLYKNGILSNKLISLDKDTLKEMGLNLGKRINFLNKIQSYLAGKKITNS